MKQSSILRGFTLIELMITVAIVGILAAIAYPSYQQYVLKSWRANASACLLELANRMERRYTGSASYMPAGVDLANERDPLFQSSCVTEGSMGDRYEFSHLNDPDATSFAIQAQPKNAQANDPCGDLTINHWGQKNVLYAQSGYDAARCWNR